MIKVLISQLVSLQDILIRGYCSGEDISLGFFLGFLDRDSVDGLTAVLVARRNLRDACCIRVKTSAAVDLNYALVAAFPGEQLILVFFFDVNDSRFVLLHYKGFLGDCRFRRRKYGFGL